MKVAFIIYNEITALDFIGVYDPISRLKTMGFLNDIQIDICACTEDVIDFAQYIRIKPNQIGGTLKEYDMIIVPGGYGSRVLMGDTGFLAWLKTSKAQAIKASVCTGSLLLGAAGFLQDKSATTHPNAYEELRPLCGMVKKERIVEDGNIITARGVTAGIDLGLFLCERISGLDVKEKIVKQMDYIREP